MNLFRVVFPSALVCGLLLFQSPCLQAQGTSFTYQGRMTDSGGNPVNNTRNLQFRLFSSQSGGSPIATVQYTNVVVSNGLFTVQVDLGNNYDGSPRWLEIQDLTVGATFARQPITPAPYAIYARTSGAIHRLFPSRPCERSHRTAISFLKHGTPAAPSPCNRLLSKTG